jgi:hypothetical protein
MTMMRTCCDFTHWSRLEAAILDSEKPPVHSNRRGPSDFQVRLPWPNQERQVTGERRTARGAGPSLRSDARRNRDDVLAAAVLAFTKDANASLESIARAAGVGIGMLYRHFPTREALVEAAYRNEIQRLCAAAPELLEKYRPDVALASWL